MSSPLIYRSTQLTSELRYGDVDDRIRAIANGLGLRTIVWGYDSNDWQEGLNGITDADVDNFYQQFINNATSGNFNSVRRPSWRL